MTVDNKVLPGGRVPVVEDDADSARLIEMHLIDCGCEVKVVRDGIHAGELANDESFSLITLDVSLPGIDGIELCRRIRRRSNYTPILMLSARSSELDRVLGLEIGADDYLTKPFSVRELQARVKAICRCGDALAAHHGSAPTTIRIAAW